MVVLLREATLISDRAVSGAMASPGGVELVGAVDQGTSSTRFLVSRCIYVHFVVWSITLMLRILMR